MLGAPGDYEVPATALLLSCGPPKGRRICCQPAVPCWHAVCASCVYSMLVCKHRCFCLQQTYISGGMQQDISFLISERDSK